MVRCFFPVRCDCGWFSESQVEDFYLGNRQPVPLFGNFFTVDPYVCTLPAGGVNDCKTQCQNWADEILADGFNLCRRTPLEGNPRCWGGFMCETLNTEGFPTVRTCITIDLKSQLAQGQSYTITHYSTISVFFSDFRLTESLFLCGTASLTALKRRAPSVSGGRLTGSSTRRCLDIQSYSPR